MSARHPRVFTIPAAVAFLPTLVEALAGGRIFGDTPIDLADATIYVPTQRSGRALAALIAESVGGRAQLLPRIVPLGDADDAAFEIIESGHAFADPGILAPPIPPLERRLVLTRLIQRWSAEVDRDLLQLGPGIPFLVPSSPADAVNLAGDLEALMDSFTTEGIEWDRLGLAVEGDYSRYFEITRRFVEIASASWPAILGDIGASDPVRRRNALLLAEAERLLRDRPTAPVIVAGSTGSMPATAALMAAIAHLPFGAVVLPGLDTDLDEASWAALGALPSADADPVHSHPQAILRRLLGVHLKIPRDVVTVLGSPPPSGMARSRLLSEVLRPAETTDRWSAIPALERFAASDAGCEGIAIVEAADERDEALAIAIALRETLAVVDRTAVLVTPDRALASRVAAELARWNITVEDSAGQALSDTLSGRLARLVADAAAEDLRPVRLVALLAHPQVRLGLTRAQIEHAASVLEIGVLRGPAPANGLEGLREALEERRTGRSRHTPRACKRLSPADWDRAADLLVRLESAFANFTADAHGEGAMDLVPLAAVHHRVIDGLRAAPDEEPGTFDPSYEHLVGLFDDLAQTQLGSVIGRFTDYPSFFTNLAKTRTFNPSHHAAHRRVKILGLLEARLLSADRVVVGGLDEGVWPPRTTTDAFLNRPMRTNVGLAPPERRIGQTAHDFVQALGTSDVVITRAQKRGDSPMVPSRFLQRLKAFTGDAIYARMVMAGERYRGFARHLDAPPPAPALPRPRPKPDAALFPRALSVTEIETLIRDPYSIFAKHILKLDALDPLAVAPGASDRGTIIHDVFGRFAQDHPRALPAQAREEVLARGVEAFARIERAFPELHAEWWPRFRRLADAFVDWEEKRRDKIAIVHAERSGALRINLSDGSVFDLRARADRIEEGRDGGFTVIDFKTGAVPSPKEVFAGFSPQLTLEATMLMRGSFKDIAPTQGVPDLLYVQTTGGREPLKERPIAPSTKDARNLSDIVAEHFRRFEGMVARYAAGEVAYLSRPFPKYARRFSDYDHLARVKEWSLAAGDDGEEAV